MNITRALWGEIILSLIIIGLSVFLLNTFGGTMSDALFMSVSVGLVSAFAVFAGFIWRERAHDEREALHRMQAGRIGFLIGACILVIGIIVQGFAHSLDPWLVAALSGMLIGKIIALSYNKVYK